MTAGILATTTFCAVAFPKIVSVLSFFGGFSSVILSFFLPCTCGWR